MSDGIEHLQEQTHARANVERTVLAPAIDRLALDVFEYQVRLTVAGYTRLAQARDIRMREPRERTALAFEALGTGAAKQRQVQQLDRHASRITSIAAMSEPHGAHAAAAERPLQRITADGAPDERRLDRQRRRHTFQKALLVDRRLPMQQRGQVVRQVAVRIANMGEPRTAHAVVRLQQLVEQRAQDTPAMLVDP